MARTDAQLKLRLPAELKERIENAAKENKRSVNAELVSRLEATFNLMPRMFAHIERRNDLEAELQKIEDVLSDILKRDGLDPDEEFRLARERREAKDEGKA